MIAHTGSWTSWPIKGIGTSCMNRSDHKTCLVLSPRNATLVASRNMHQSRSPLYICVFDKLNSSSSHIDIRKTSSVVYASRNKCWMMNQESLQWRTSPSALCFHGMCLFNLHQFICSGSLLIQLHPILILKRYQCFWAVAIQCVMLMRLHMMLQCADNLLDMLFS